jgi:hypothetical protein
MHLITYFFHWPDGSVWGNLIASLLWAAPLWVIGYFKLKKQQHKHHQQLERQLNDHFVKLTDKMNNNGN